MNDVMVKLVSEKLPLGELMFVRGLMASTMIACLLVATGLHRQFGLLRHKAVAGRLAGELGGTFFYLLALFHMPIANVVIIFQASPLAVTAAAALLLRERVGWRRWIAIGIGFVGVLVVVRPGLSGFDMFGIAVLVSVLFIALRDLATRAMPESVPTMLVTLATAVVVTLMGAFLGFAETWTLPDLLTFGQLAAAAFFLSVGYGLIIVAMRIGELSATAPFRYVAVVAAVLLGFLVWREVPDGLTLLGSMIIVATGLYALYRERIVLRERPGPAAISATQKVTGG
jgi:drug/metabolite transporter (DMT)-like permease